MEKVADWEMKIGNETVGKRRRKAMRRYRERNEYLCLFQNQEFSNSDSRLLMYL